MSEQPKHQWTVMFDYVRDGVKISENFTERHDDWEELKTSREKILGFIPNTKTFPNDYGQKATSATAVVNPVPVCPDHSKPFRKGQYGDYCPTKLSDGTWCKRKPT